MRIDFVRVDAADPGEALTGYARNSPVKCYAPPDEITGAALLWMDDRKASFGTGHILNIEGRFAAKFEDLSTSLCNPCGYKYSIIYLMRI